MSSSKFTEAEVKILKGIVEERVASLKELKGKYTDREVRKDPPKYTGPSCVGLKWSQCTPDYLDDLASFTEWRIGKEKEKPEAEQRRTQKGELAWKYDERDAKLIRAWAMKLRIEGPKQVAQAAQEAMTDPEHPAVSDADEAAANGEDPDQIPF